MLIFGITFVWCAVRQLGWRRTLIYTVIAVGVSRYYTDVTHRTLDREYHNLWVIELDGDGRCRSFTEWFMKTPKPRRKS